LVYPKLEANCGDTFLFNLICKMVFPEGSQQIIAGSIIKKKKPSQSALRRAQILPSRITEDCFVFQVKSACSLLPEDQLSS